MQSSFWLGEPNYCYFLLIRSATTFRPHSSTTTLASEHQLRVTCQRGRTNSSWKEHTWKSVPKCVFISELSPFYIQSTTYKFYKTQHGAMCVLAASPRIGERMSCHDPGWGCVLQPQKVFSFTAWFYAHIH